MIWIGVAASALLGLALIIRRQAVAHMQSMVMGGRLTPGCVVAQAVFFLGLALLGVTARLLGWIP